jgi:hypothetical protein
VLAAVAGILAVSAASGAARAQTQLPDPAAFVPWLDVKCYVPDAVAQGQVINQPVVLTQLNPRLATVPRHQVVVGNLQELCVPVMKNHTSPPPSALPWERFVDLACYGLQNGPTLNFQMTLTQLNPVVRRMAAQLPGLLREVVTVGPAQQLCVPVAKNPDQVPLPPEVQRLIQFLDVECFGIQGPTVSLPQPLVLSHLNPLLAQFPDETVQVLSPSQICLPVSKNDQALPADVANLVSRVDIKKYRFMPVGPDLTVNLRLHQLNPVFANVPDVPVRTLSPRELGLPVRKDQVGVNKDLLNTTGQVANDIEILLEGQQLVTFHYDGNGQHVFNSFTSVITSAGNTLLTWSSPTNPVPPLDVAHVGFTVLGTGKILAVSWTQNGNVIGCAHQVNAHPTPDAGQVQYDNSVLQCESIPLVAGRLRVEWHAAEVPLDQLNPGVDRQPIRTDVIPDAPVVIQAGGSAAVNIPPPPTGAAFMVLVHQVADNASLSNPTNDFLEFQLAPAPTAIPAAGGWTMLLVVAVLLAGAAAFRLRQLRKRVAG